MAWWIASFAPAVTITCDGSQGMRFSSRVFPAIASRSGGRPFPGA